MKLASLRKKYPVFTYESFGYKFNEGNLEISFVFRIEPDIIFKPKIVIKNAPKNKSTKDVLDNFVFHLGLMEIPSYWKAVCSPEIIIKAGYLSKEQLSWWKDLIIKGMGQFFYENKIDWRDSNFLNIKAGGAKKPYGLFGGNLKNRYLVPMGGGKDSIVTLEKLKWSNKEINCFAVNPSQATKDVLRVAGIKDSIVVERKIDPALLALNKKGFLNGHAPFTAVLSFLAVFCAVLFDYKNIAFSNEKSADEGNVRYLGKIINHQYSKSSEFEGKFKTYCQKYLAKNVNYFSFLRKYTELEIAKMFAQYPQYFSAFSSCNQGLKTGEKWCGKCPKCLFVYISLYPYLKKEEILKMFHKDLFEDKKLLPIMKELVGEGEHKPFECVGTYQESKSALKLCQKKAGERGAIPYLLTKVISKK